MYNVEISLTSGQVLEIPNVDERFIKRYKDEATLTIEVEDGTYYVDVDEIVYLKVLN